jgi:glutamate racemase
MDNSSAPIGVFDSGIGGLTVLREIRALLPNEDIVYLGDTARVPYGVRSADTVRRYASEGTAFLQSKGIKLLVIACNTVSALGLDDITAMVDVPVIGVIKPGARAAARHTLNGRVGVIGTVATVDSGAYVKAIKEARPLAEVYAEACPLFVPLVEEGWIDGTVPELTVEHYLTAMKDKDIDTLVLGCTHYPLLMPILRKVMGDGVKLIDSATETAQEVHEMLKAGNALSGSKGKMEFYVTDSPQKFLEVGERFLGMPIENITKITMEAQE